MTTNSQPLPDVLRRKQLRLKHYDYSLPGYYYVTICTHQRKHYFGEVTGTPPCLCGSRNSPHLMIEKWLLELQNRFAVMIGPYVIMPNHLHFIVAKKQAAETLGDVVRWFKTMTTNEYIAGVRRGAYEPFDGRLWQRDFYERVISNEREHRDIGEYIRANLMNWDIDEENL